jgi:hypothetical protein
MVSVIRTFSGLIRAFIDVHPVDFFNPRLRSAQIVGLILHIDLVSAR